MLFLKYKKSRKNVDITSLYAVTGTHGRVFDIDITSSIRSIVIVFLVTFLFFLSWSGGFVVVVVSLCLDDDIYRSLLSLLSTELSFIHLAPPPCVVYAEKLFTRRPSP